MDYEKKYKEALTKAAEYYSNEQCRVGMTPIELEEIFPELRESEDEEIKNWLIHTALPSISCDKEWKRKVKTWLEKQGEKSQEELPHKYNVGDWIVSKYNSIYQVKEVLKGSYNLLSTNNAEEINSISVVDNSSRLLCITDIQNLEKQSEQKTVEWSKERNIISTIIIEVSARKEYYRDTHNDENVKKCKKDDFMARIFAGKMNSKC